MSMITTEKAFLEKGFNLRIKLLEMHYKAKSAHIGSGLSCLDIMSLLFHNYLHKDDVFILSKGHAAAALYLALFDTNKISEEQLNTYYKDGTYLSGHPAPCGIDAIAVATGALGHGLPIACGQAFAKKHYKQSPHRVFALLSDGECNEGTTWEAALFAAHHKLDNLVVIVDQNKLQGFGRTEDVLSLAPFEEKWKSFGFDVLQIDGHDYSQIKSSLEFKSANKPLCIIADTVKGKGVSFMEDTLDWHYLSMTEEKYNLAITELKHKRES